MRDEEPAEELLTRCPQAVQIFENLLSSICSASFLHGNSVSQGETGLIKVEENQAGLGGLRSQHSGDRGKQTSVSSRTAKATR